MSRGERRAREFGGTGGLPSKRDHRPESVKGAQLAVSAQGESMRLTRGVSGRMWALVAAAATVAPLALLPAQTTSPAPPARSPDVPFVPTQMELVRSMLDVAK